MSKPFFIDNSTEFDQAMKGMKVWSHYEPSENGAREVGVDILKGEQKITLTFDEIRALAVCIKSKVERAAS